MSKKLLVSVASARPNFVKLAAVHHAWKDHFQDEFDHIIVHTGQHYDQLLSDVFFQQLDIPQPTENLGVAGGTREEMISRTKDALRPVLEKYKPACVLVYGDVNGALAAAETAKELGIPVAHVEAGLRSYDDTMPEEHNRIGVDKIAQYLFCTEQSGMDHLEEEGMPGKRELVGNTMINTLIRAWPMIEKSTSSMSVNGKYAIATIHRPSNVDDLTSLTKVLEFLHEIAERTPVILPAHPRLKNALNAMGFSQKPDDPLRIMEPLPYVEFLNFLSKSAFVVTDSGGIQEEAVFLKKRCFTLRRNTERPITIECGSNILIDPDNQDDRKIALDFAKDPDNPAITLPPMWDGHAGERILKTLAESL